MNEPESPEPKPTGSPNRDTPESLLDARRAEIESIDAKILELVCRRIGIVEEIGRVKKSSKTPLRNFGVEERVKGRLRTLCRELGIEETLGEDLALFLIRKAVEVQSPIVDAVYGGDRLEVLVVGGMGGMGRWMSRFLNSQGHRVTVHDTAPGDCPFPRAVTLEAAVPSADLVLVAVPMSATPGVLRRIGELDPRGVVAEISSLKSPLREPIDELRESGVRVVSLHPMFGPDTRLLSGKQIVLCRAGASYEDDENFVRGLFEDTSARIVDVPLDRHDRYMAAVLGMAHLVNLGFASALSHYGLPFEELLDVASVTFLKQIVTTREVVGENPSLYYEIQDLNPATGDVIESLIASFEKLRDVLATRDPDAFERLMDEERAYFGEAATPRRADLWEAIG